MSNNWGYRATMSLEERKQDLAWKIRTSGKVRGMESGEKKEGKAGGCIWALKGRRGIWGAAIRLTMHPRAAHLGDLQLSSQSLTPPPLNAAAGQSPYKSVQAGSSESSAPWSQRVMLPTPRKHPVIHSELCTRSSRDEENLVGDQSSSGWRA
ncbi:hypothetical protein L207DRAFT_588780 [Hyaloscypha variabilis F]|jgi:hypothetical protein|uniref:Uncharacterized protein n=1 Tax=Hyaloscypha variabilis (strain UAMH 11265 / GT02V1 / F) TaxID=1149755 RepID=A0A2J6R6N8_HYAVF|nr:hypothetical protein L207DRAFT_588780 [Hyaloscypha variabilis F]